MRKQALTLIIGSVFLMGLGLSKASPKREMRGVWVATVNNIDWPSKPSISTIEKRAELNNIISSHREQGLNAIFFQVRPSADAFYNSSYELWSNWLTGAQGKAPEDNFDPLEESITLCHKNGMELHAWFNPYRAVFSEKSKIHPSHISKLAPEWFFSYEGKKLFNPGIPEVREYIVRVVLDVLKKYDVDGIHLDDYFYPYPVPGKKINDDNSYQDYAEEGESIDDWRRENVNKLIKMLADSINFYKPHVKFGISPFGIWKNKKQDDLGSATNGISSYYALYADTRKWLQEGWIDYVAPQNYFCFGNKAAAYEVLTDWWAENSFGKHLYIGHAMYRIGEKGKWANANEIPNQIRYNRENTTVNGSIFFSSTSLTKNKMGVTDSLKNDFYAHPALPPIMEWKDKIVPLPPQNVSLSKLKNKQVQLSWQPSNVASDGDEANGYVVYRFELDEPIDIENADHIVHISFDKKTTSYTEAWDGKEYRYMVTALDKNKNESEASEALSVKK